MGRGYSSRLSIDPVMVAGNSWDRAVIAEGYCDGVMVADGSERQCLQAVIGRGYGCRWLS